VRQQLEYASSVWDNPVKYNAGKVEAVQRTSEVQHGPPVVTSNVHQVSQSGYRNSSGIHFNNVEFVAESLCCIAFAMVWWPFLLQLRPHKNKKLVIVLFWKKK